MERACEITNQSFQLKRMQVVQAAVEFDDVFPHVKNV